MMKSFWWFKQDAIAGMARPGFNAFHWFDLPFREAVLLGWLGKFSNGAPLDSFRTHLEEYVPKIFRFYGLGEKAGAEAVKVFESREGFQKVVRSLSELTGLLEKYEVTDSHLRFRLSAKQLNSEIDFLKKNGIRRVVSLTEDHHQADVLGNHFSLHHIGIEDLGAPKIEQVHKLAEILKSSGSQKLAVHCLAGIGRTSTMLMSAHVLLGESAAELEALLKKQNPKFILTGPQAEFIRSLSR